MTQIKQRFFYSEAGSGRDASHYVHAPRDLDKNGNPPPWMLPQIIVEPFDDEIEFDHRPTQIELAIAFAKRKEKADVPSDQEQ